MGLAWPQPQGVLRSVPWVSNSPGTKKPPGCVFLLVMVKTHENKPRLTSQPQEFQSKSPFRPKVKGQEFPATHHDAMGAAGHYAGT